MVLLGADGLLNAVVQNIAITDWCGSLPYKWNKKKNRLEEKSCRKLLIYKLHLACSILYIFMAFIQVAYNWKGSSLMVIIHGVMILTCAVGNMACHLVNLKEIKAAVALFNCFIEFERRERHFKTSTAKNGRNMRKFITKYFLSLSLSTGLLMPVLYHLDILRNPCIPMYVGYWMSDLCHQESLGRSHSPTCTTLEIGTKVWISLVSYYVWSFLLVGFCSAISIDMVLYAYCLYCHIRNYGETMMEARKVKDIKWSTFLTYRELQLMCLEYRNTFSKYMLGIKTSCLCVIQIVCLYNTVLLAIGIDSTGGSLGYNLLYGWGGMACTFDAVGLGRYFSDVYTMSRKSHEMLSRNSMLRRDRWCRRWIRSCQILKIYFGGSNFFDEMTSLVLLSFVIDKTTSLLLLRK